MQCISHFHFLCTMCILHTPVCADHPVLDSNEVTSAKWNPRIHIGLRIDFCASSRAPPPSIQKNRERMKDGEKPIVCNNCRVQLYRNDHLIFSFLSVWFKIATHIIFMQFAVLVYTRIETLPETTEQICSSCCWLLILLFFFFGWMKL